MILCHPEARVPGEIPEKFVQNAVYIEDLPPIDGPREPLEKYAGQFESVWAEYCSLDTYKNHRTYENVHMMLKHDGYFILNGLAKARREHRIEDLSKLLNSVDGLFLMFGEELNAIYLRKVTTLPPEITTAEAVNDAITRGQPLDALFNRNPDKTMCQLESSRTSKVVGSGVEGELLWFQDWRSDVLIKVIDIDQVYFDSRKTVLSKSPVNGTYIEGRIFLEAMASAMLTGLATGESGNYLINIPRYTGYFACPSEEGETKLYIIIEYIRGFTLGDSIRLGHHLKIKSTIWQALFALITLSELGWMHQDAHGGNVLVHDIREGETYFGQPLETEEWLYEMGNDRWVLKHHGRLAKLIDFGLAVHVERPPVIEMDQKDVDAIAAGGNFGVDNVFKPAYDVNYLITHLTVQDRAYFAELERDWRRLMGAGPRDPVYDRKTLRPLARWDNWNIRSILDAEYFSDIVKRV